jgi:hypothetical protein
VVSTCEALPKLTVPGPLSLLQAVVTLAGGFGLPSSVTVPSSAAPLAMPTVWSGPADTEGGPLPGDVSPLKDIS